MKLETKFRDSTKVTYKLINSCLVTFKATSNTVNSRQLSCNANVVNKFNLKEYFFDSSCS